MKYLYALLLVCLLSSAACSDPVGIVASALIAQATGPQAATDTITIKVEVPKEILDEYNAQKQLSLQEWVVLVVRQELKNTRVEKAKRELQVAIEDIDNGVKAAKAAQEISR